MQKIPTFETTKDVVQNSILVLSKVFTAIEAFFQKVSELILRGIGIILCTGGLLAIAGWLLAALNNNPSAPTWNVAAWLVISGVFVLVLGMQALAMQYLLRLGVVSQYAMLVFLFGALVLIAGVFVIDLFILPALFKLASQFPNLSAGLQGAYNTVQQGANTATSTVTSGATDACNTIANNLPFGGGSSCPSTSTPSVPDVAVPSFTLDDLLTQIGLPSITALGALGLSFMSGVTLAPGCLVMGLIFLVGGLRPRSAVLLLIASAVLNLSGQFFLGLPVIGPIIGILPFLALAWLGFAIWSPVKLKRAGATSQPDTVVAATSQPDTVVAAISSDEEKVDEEKTDEEKTDEEKVDEEKVDEEKVDEKK